MSHASRRHRVLDTAAAEAMARDCGPKRRKLSQAVTNLGPDEEMQRAAVELAQDRQRYAGERRADARYLKALAGSGTRFRDADPAERRAAEGGPPPYRRGGKPPRCGGFVPGHGGERPPIGGLIQPIESTKENEVGPIGLTSPAALLPSRLRYKDLRSMSRPRVLLTRLSVRTSAKGREYLAGWLGKASVVGFKSPEPDKFGNECFDIYLSKPEPRPGTAPEGLRQRQERVSAEIARGGVDADWDSGF
jgi:hypothetical protein